MIFQITGVSRCGTAWLAAFLNVHPRCFCHHELAASRDDWFEHSNKLELLWEFVGESSTYGWYPKASRLDSKKVFIDRDPVDVVQSLHEITGTPYDVGIFRKKQEQARHWAHSNGGLIVPFESLFAPLTVMRIWEYIFPTTSVFPVDKAKEFIAMNIQRQHPGDAFGDSETARRRLL